MTLEDVGTYDEGYSTSGRVCTGCHSVSRLFIHSGRITARLVNDRNLAVVHAFQVHRLAVMALARARRVRCFDCLSLTTSRRPGLASQILVVQSDADRRTAGATGALILRTPGLPPGGQCGVGTHTSIQWVSGGIAGRAVVGPGDGAVDRVGEGLASATLASTKTGVPSAANASGATVKPSAIRLPSAAPTSIRWGLPVVEDWSP